MKLIPFAILSLSFAAKVQAADFSPNTLGPLADTSRYLQQEPLQVAEYNLSLDFHESRDFIVQTREIEIASSRVIQRRLNLALGLPALTEFGFTIEDTQEGSTAMGYEAADHSSKPLSARTWLRWTALKNSWITAAITVQYQPGLATISSFHQASQDRSTLGMDLKTRPLTWLQSAVYASYSRRHEERTQNLLLGDEKQTGLRLAAGTDAFGIFGDTKFRSLETSDRLRENSRVLFAREYQAGLYVGTKSLHMSAFAFIPDTKRYVGVSERGLGASISLRLGGEPKELADENRPQAEDALVAQTKAESQLAVPSVPPSTELKVLESNEPDEFQLLTEKNKQDAIKNKTETPAEKAERELRQGMEQEKKVEAAKAKELDKKKQLESDQLKQQIRQDDERYQDYKDNVDQEINRYTLPDQDELNWNGLNPQ